MNTGRPKKAKKDRRTNIMRVCLTDAEHKEIADAAKIAGADVSVWVRTALLELVRNRAHGVGASEPKG